MKLSPRLKMVADMVRPGVVAADIGTDHAYIPVYLVQNKICPSAIAADLREGPLANARSAVLAAGFSNTILLRLSDGLDNIAPHEAQDVILAGMGGQLIVELLARTPWLRDSAKRLIIQPMTHAEDVREYLCANGFKILVEQACFEAHRGYIALCACFQETPLHDVKPSYLYIGELPLCGSAAADAYIQKVYKRLKKRVDALEVSGSNPQEATRLRDILKDIAELS